MKKFNAAGSFNMLRLMTAGIAICLCLAGVSVMTSAGGLNGFFRDITGKNNAIVSTAYENADEEISVSVSVSDDVLTVTMLPVDINAAPYKYIEQWNVSRWQLTDSEGTVIAADDPAEWAEVHDGTAEIRIPVPDLKSGTYKLNITEFLGRKKADQDLPVRGNWECEFSH